MRRLVVWNLLLAVGLTAGVYELRRQWLETHAQEQKVLLRKPIPPTMSVPPPPVKPGPFQATSYTDVAQKTLFSKDRNPNIEVVAPPPPPPPPPMPALPKMYGVLGLPSGAVAIMADKSGGTQKKVRVGEMIGEFKVAKLDTQNITLQWNDKSVEKSVDELLDRTAVPVAAAAPTPAPASGAPAPPPKPTGPPQFGVEIGAPGQSVRACVDQSSETAPAGTVIEGYTKVKEKTPFGEACRWIQNK